ncbi:class I SAM-dependent methyltransferase [Bdellovibrio sp. HCB2-146]|uniref:class I SAM-dependent methyltransferase n=1 Tax=Bdellovibrio sp. HCB2-146 TaxID=3394362 RepID=UPI0039BD6315
MNKPTTDFFNKEAAQRYDERNSKLSRISDCLHFLTTLALKDLPAKSRILCVGVGTGAEIMTLAQTFPEWTFVGLDPSQNMLDVCQDRMKAAGFASRCEFVHGFIQDLPVNTPFDAAVSFLVAHFVKREERLSFFQNMTKHLKDHGYLVNAEISFDLDSPEFPLMLKGWEQVQSLMGATPESLATLPKQLKEMLTVLPPSETEAILRQSGINLPMRFFQAMMICGWYGKKASN